MAAISSQAAGAPATSPAAANLSGSGNSDAPAREPMIIDLLREPERPLSPSGMYAPFGKFFHIIQRPAQLGVQFYKEEGARGEQARCIRSGEAYQSQLQHDDLADVMKDIGSDCGEHQNLSPQEKRKLIALNQLAILDETGYVG